MTAPEPEHGADASQDARADADVPPVAASSPWKALLFALFVAGSVGILSLPPVRDSVGALRNHQFPGWFADLRATVGRAGGWGALEFVAGCALAISLGVPRLALAFLGGALYGWIAGSLLAQFGTFFGCWGTFVVGRHLGRDWVQARVARRFPRAKSLLAFISRHGFLSNVLLRLTPVGNAFTTNMLFAVSSVSLGSFLMATFVGTFPETVIAALIGSAAKGTDMAERILGGVAALAVLAVVVAWWTRRLRRPGGDATAAGPAVAQAGDGTE